MPKLPEGILNNVFYLYDTAENALEGKKIGGTGFFIGQHTGIDTFNLYAITNNHVAIKGNSPKIRLNKNDGSTDVLDLSIDDWRSDDDDIAITGPLELSNDIYDFSFMPSSYLVDQSDKKRLEIGPGDDVFMVGRFVDHDGGITNTPSVRFGNISVDPMPIKQTSGYMGDSYVIDIRSRSGYSGSPVFIYRTPASYLEAQMKISSGEGDFVSGGSFCMVLGIHWGQFPETWQLKTNSCDADFENQVLLTDGSYVQGLSGMTTVIPAWKIQDLIRNKG